MKTIVLLGMVTCMATSNAFAQCEHAAHPTAPHVIDGDSVWLPAPGYKWVGDSADDLAVAWKPWSRYKCGAVIKWPNIRSGSKEGTWYPEPGYVWAERDASGNPVCCNVQWKPGIANTFMGRTWWAHVVASEVERKWIPEPGYDWANRDDTGRPIPGDLNVLSVGLLDRWSKYLSEIQRDGAYRNWSSAPYDAYIARGGRSIDPSAPLAEALNSLDTEETEGS